MHSATTSASLRAGTTATTETGALSACAGRGSNRAIRQKFPCPRSKYAQMESVRNPAKMSIATYCTKTRNPWGILKQSEYLR
jgi:hypothetical protein